MQKRYLCILFLCLMFLAGCREKGSAWEEIGSSGQPRQTEESKAPETEAAHDKDSDQIKDSGQENGTGSGQNRDLSNQHSEDDYNDAMITVHVIGAVMHPGVYTLPETSRVVDAVEMAGGFDETADTEWVNLARPLTDAEQIIIYRVDETAEMERTDKAARDGAGQTGISSEQPAASSETLVNLNTASKDELMTLSGIGDSRAQAIIDYRESSGGFQSIEEIMQISGIKNALFDKIRDHITV